MKIDKNRFTLEELAQYEALVAKGAVVEESPANPDETPPAPGVQKNEPTPSPAETPVPPPAPETPPATETQKSEMPPELAAALDRLGTLEKSLGLQKIREVAKKYALLGEDEDALAQTLYAMSKSDETAYKSYVAILDKSLDIVNQFGIFGEIGKSTGGYGSANGGVLAQIDAKAAEIMKADPGMDKYAAIAKAWEDNPDLAIAYDREYEGS